MKDEFWKIKEDIQPRKASLRGNGKGKQVKK